MLAAAAAAAIGLAPGCGRSQTSVLRLSHITSPGSSWDRGARRFAELVEARSGGRLRVEVYPAGQLAQSNQRTELQQLGNGAIDMVLVSPIILALFLDKRYDAFSLPWLFPDHDVAARVCEGPFGAEALGWLEEHGIHGIAYGANGFRQLTNSVHPVREPADLKGMKVRVAGTDLFRAVFTAFGANPTTMNFGEVFSALQQGTISAQENPLSIIDSSKLYEVQRYLTLWNYAYDPLVLAIGKPRWDRLAPEDRQLLTACGREAMAFQRDVVREDDERLAATLAAKGMQVERLNAAQIQSFRDVCKGVYDEFRPRIGESAVTDIQAAVEGLLSPGPRR